MFQFISSLKRKWVSSMNSSMAGYLGLYGVDQFNSEWTVHRLDNTWNLPDISRKKSNDGFRKKWSIGTCRDCYSCFQSRFVTQRARNFYSHHCRILRVTVTGSDADYRSSAHLISYSHPLLNSEVQSMHISFDRSITEIDRLCSITMCSMISRFPDQNEEVDQINTMIRTKHSSRW